MLRRNRDKSSLARRLEHAAPGLLREMTDLLSKAGFENVQVESFEVRQADVKVRGLEALVDECPTRCVVMPDNSIRCFPDCG